MTSPERYKTLDELTPAEMFAWRRDPSVRFETDTYREAKDKALVNAGFEPEESPVKDLADLTPEEVADLSPSDYLARLHGERS